MFALVRFLSRFGGFLFLAAALVAAVVDGSKMIAQSGLVFTSFGDFWTMAFGGTLTRAASLEAVGLGEPVMATALDYLAVMPVSIVFSGLGLFLMWLGWPRQRRSLSFG